ncbi:uncharacterized protein LOC129596822 [Paramacrobiotus metropolitanus]|uniref:uncharacterized protein LOC129596822 n=1 Tax=Paramacrobiotus metropolitanus TaxID=2943436 RepID=UPI0024462FF5|nr:uncharacterized protein LOC129596822 [Paramacrobiotus metropolitanus]
MLFAADARVLQMFTYTGGEKAQPSDLLSLSASSSTDIVPACNPATGNAYSNLPAGHFSEAAARTHRNNFMDVLELRKSVGYQNLPNLLICSGYTAPYAGRYWYLSRERSEMLQTAALNITAAYQEAYGDLLHSFDVLQASAAQGFLPHQPQATPAQAVWAAKRTLEDRMFRLCRFTAMLPSFQNLGNEDRRTLLAEKYLISIMITNARYYYRSGYYIYLTGSDPADCIHYCRDVREQLQLDPDFVQFIDKFNVMFNDLGLTVTETYMLLTVALFAAGYVTEIVDKPTMRYLHAIYLDALFYLVGHRLNPAERLPVYAKVETLMTMFPLVDRITANYLSHVKIPSIPMRPESVVFRDCVGQ